MTLKEHLDKIEELTKSFEPVSDSEPVDLLDLENQLVEFAGILDKLSFALIHYSTIVREERLLNLEQL